MPIPKPMPSPRLPLFLALVLAACAPLPRSLPEADRQAATARRVSIVRDDWGIPHVHGRTDADAIFGLIYAQAEDDFNRVETNYLGALGRLAEADGEGAIWRDLRMKLFIDPEALQAQYRSSPAFLQRLAEAWADGLNLYLAKHPEVHPRVLRRFEPWMVLAFSEGSIGGDIESVSLAGLEAFYGRAVPGEAVALRGPEREPTGSNGFAIAGSNTASGRPLLLINPHTSFFFRAEAQVQSDEGLDAYGAITWGQFFVYQGFNRRVGWMHTSTGADAIDEYAETIVQRAGGLYYRFGNEERPVVATRLSVPYRTAAGPAVREFTVYRTHHGPIVRTAGGRWISVRLMQEPVKALLQSYTRTKATSYSAFRKAMELHANSSNNTVFADADGNIAYFHPSFVPKRDPSFDWTRPVDGSDPATEWKGVHSLEESIEVKNPPGGWIQNTNNWPYSVAGPASPRREEWPAYMDGAGENPRGLHAVRLLQHHLGFTLDSLIAAAFDPALPGFEGPLPALLRDWDGLAASAPLRARLSGPIAALRGWDLRWSAASVPTTLAVLWAEALSAQVKSEAAAAKLPVLDFIALRATAGQRLDALAAVVGKLAADFGTWELPWGELNRFQRLTGDLEQPFDDARPSLPVPFASGSVGSLASFGARAYAGSKRIYGTSGNSFVAVVEFGDRVRAKAVSAGGQSGHPESKHFNDQAERYASGRLRDVYLYPEDLQGHVEREYHPGE